MTDDINTELGKRNFQKLSNDNSSGIVDIKVQLGFLSIPHALQNPLSISSLNNESTINRCKGFLEDYTRLEWDWWPLAPRVPNVKAGQFRLEWMFGGVQLYECISSVQADTIQALIPLLPQHPEFCCCCHTKKHQSNLLKTREGIFRFISSYFSKQKSNAPSNNGGQSKAGKRYTPTSFTVVTSSSCGTQSVSLEGSNGSDDANTSPSMQTQVPNVPENLSSDPLKRMLFAIQGSRWSLDLEQISVSTQLNDPAFFRELNTRYKKHRNWIKRMVSPFRFRFCKFVRFEKFDAERILSQGEDLPEDPVFQDDYEYAPRPGKNPMINPKTFAVCLKVCDDQCTWRLLNPWHDCVTLPRRPHRIRCIPKKKSEFDLQSDDVGLVAWGLEADYAISFAYLAMYHLIPLIGALVFWIYWLIRFPGDWQNAAVPVLTVLAMFAVLWMLPFNKNVISI
ncbi:hypothetical protein GQ44DRAFT_703430 [Phaeosphaeriaceae sp. PMI808]|nr:hypothetical protein GQ44DRAFT_703430 [Phaeosphaeriaceae sp. PMI808]